jgi:hypothetical protein
MNKVNFKQELVKQDVYVPSQIVSLSDLTGMPTRQGLERAVVCGGQIVNVVSSKYGHLPNEDFFTQANYRLEEAGLAYDYRSINRGNRSFAVDYILNDPNVVIEVKGSNDKIKPMLRLVNSYDGSCKTQGSFGFFRQVCQNGLHVAHTRVGFNIKHHAGVAEVAMPKIDELIRIFIDNEFYTIRRRFEVMAETLVENPKEYLRQLCHSTNVFQYEASSVNDGPSANARLVLEIAETEARHLQTPVNQWLMYNAVNNVIHNKLKMTFQTQQGLDAKVFNYHSN